MNPLLLLDIACIGGIVTLSKILYDSFKNPDGASPKRIKFDTVTDLRLKRKAFNDKNYKNDSYKSRGSKGI